MVFTCSFHLNCFLVRIFSASTRIYSYLRTLFDQFQQFLAEPRGGHDRASWNLKVSVNLQCPRKLTLKKEFRITSESPPSSAGPSSSPTSWIFTVAVLSAFSSITTHSDPPTVTRVSGRERWRPDQSFSRFRRIRGRS